jgi:exodeoxyribonuclease VII small subunit
MNSKKSFHFEKSLSDLEDIITGMEKGELSLEESLKKFEIGIKLTRDCQSALNQAEQTVKILVESNGDLALEEFKQNEDEQT